VRRLAQGSVLRFGFLIYGQVGVGVFPERQEIFIRFSRCLLIVHDYLGTRQLQDGKSARYETDTDPE
jgi:hypothetical protein